MNAHDLTFVRGMEDTRSALRRWSDGHWRVLVDWTGKSLLITVALLIAVYVIAAFSTPDPTPLEIVGLTRPAQASDVASILFRNSLVLALHAFACIAGFLAGASMPLEAARRQGIWSKVHDWAGTLATWFVVGATTFSLLTQAFALGANTASVAAQLGTTPAILLTGLLLHAIPELTALFLPLAAWLVASRRGEWNELLAATFVTVAVAVPVLVVSVFVEAYLSPDVIRMLITA
jgi:Stage II sporulation protein M